MGNLAYYLEMARKVRSLKASSKVWNYVKYRTLKREAVTRVARYAPQIADVKVTKRCNLNCGYCSAGKFMKEGIGNWKESEATLEKIQEVFKNPLFRNALLVDLMGGEPLLVKDLDHIVAFLSKQGHIINTSTNGAKLMERVVDLKQAGISRINVSYYDANRNILENDLARINRIFPVHVSYVLLRSTMENEPEKIEEMARFLHRAGSLSLRFWIYRPMGANISPDEIVADTDPVYLELKRRLDGVLPGFTIWPKGVVAMGGEKRCPQLWQRVGCDPSGAMSVCCGVDEMLTGPNSNLFDADPDTVFNHPRLVAMRRQLLAPGCDPPEVCLSCNLLGDPGW